MQRDGRTALLDFGITGRLDEPKRLAFLRLLITGTSGDVRGQLEALQEMGAFPPGTDLDGLIRDLHLDQPVKDPTQMSAEELITELSEITKKLLGYGARVPKELMLLVKNLMFLNGATATLAPDLDILAEITHVYLYFAERHGERIVQEIGIDPTKAAARRRRGEGRLRCAGRDRAPDVQRAPGPAPDDHQAHAGAPPATPLTCPFALYRAFK